MRQLKTSLVVIILSVIASINLSALNIQDYVLSSKNPKTLSKMTSSIDGESYYTMSDNSRIEKVSYKSGDVISTVFDSSTARNCNIKKWDGYILSDDETKILLYTNKKDIYRQSFEADYYVFEIKRNNLKPLSNNGMQQGAKFSPDARMVAFVRDNNIYLKKLDYDTEVPVTTDGEINKIINGIPDWVYQEEFGLLKIGRAHV